MKELFELTEAELFWLRQVLMNGDLLTVRRAPDEVAAGDTPGQASKGLQSVIERRLIEPLRHMPGRYRLTHMGEEAYARQQKVTA